MTIWHLKSEQKIVKSHLQPGNMDVCEKEKKA